MSRYTKRMSDSLADVEKRAAEMEHPTPPGHAGSVKTAEKYADCGEQLLMEVAPPGWGHTKAEKEKTKPDKPKSKIGGSAHEFDKDLKSGKFKGLPGDKTMKDKRASMFKLMWSMKNKGDKPHYKPGVKDKLKSQYKEEVEMDETGRAASAASDPRVDTGSSSVDTVPGYEKKFVKTQKRVGQLRTGAGIPEEHDCEEVHPNLTHKEWEAEKNEAADTWHPDPVKDKKSTSYKHHARQMATQAMKKATKPDTFGHLKITPDQLAARRRVRATEETISEAEWEVKLKGLPTFYIPAKSAGAVKQMLRKQLKRPMDDIESVTRATPAAKKKDFRQRAQGKSSTKENRGES